MDDNTKPANKEIEEYTMGMGRVNLITVIMIIPIAVLILLPFILIWGYEIFKIGKESFMDYFILIFLGGMIIHELLHGLTWGYFASNGFKSIKFGLERKFLTPYCHCKEPLKVKHYKIGVAMPLIVMGIIPSIIGLILGYGEVLCFGIFFTWAAGGDIIALFMLRKLESDVYVSDHPKKMGFIREIG